MLQLPNLDEVVVLAGAGRLRLQLMLVDVQLGGRGYLRLSMAVDSSLCGRWYYNAG